MKVYVVHCTRSGYAREDAPSSDVVGVYTEEQTAITVSRVCGGRYKEIEVDYIHPGHRNAAAEFGFKL